MAYLRDRGYPVPAVEQLSADETGLVMERVDGPTMVDAISRAPWTIRHHGRTLAGLHRRLHDLGPPPFLMPAPVGHGDRFLHMDLHPLNVLIGPEGPVVIDWTNARAGDPFVDVGLAWALMAAGDVPAGRVTATLLGWGRALLLNAFLAPFDRDEVTRRLRQVVTWKARDANMSADEIARMWALVERAETRTARRAG